MRINGKHAWLIGLTWAALYDIAADDGETLSEAFDRFRYRHPIIAWTWIAATAAHLLRIVPPNLDPYGGIWSIKRHNLAHIASSFGPLG